MKVSDLLISAWIAGVSFLIAPDVLTRTETITFLGAMWMISYQIVKHLRIKYQQMLKDRNKHSLERQRERLQKSVNFPHRKRYYILPITERCER